MKLTLRKNGFSLIELMIAISIMMILATVGLVSYRQANAGARDSQRKADLETFKQAMVLYHAQNGQYPVVATSGTTGFNDINTLLVNEGYLSEALVDPENAFPQVYGLGTADANIFSVCVALENNPSPPYCVFNP